MTKLEKIIKQIKSGQAENITEIYLGSNQISDDGAIELANALKKSNLPNIKKINLLNNQIGNAGAKAFAEALKEANLPNLEEIYLGFNKIGNAGAKAFAEALKEANLPNLEEIYLGSNQIGNAGARAFAEALKKSNLQHLRCIRLSGNQIGSEGAEAFSKALKKANLPHLKEVYLGKNQIKDKGAKALASALKEANLPYLKEFNLFSNLIGDEGAEAFSKALKEINLPYLEVINLSGNEISDEGTEVLESYLKSNKKYLAKATEETRQKLQLNWYPTAEPIKKALIDIEYAKLLQEEGKLKVAIDLYGAALHSFRHFQEAAPEFLNIKQIIKQTTEDMKIAIKKYKAKVGKPKLPVFVLLECFEHLNAKAFERDLLKLFADRGIKSLWDENLATVIFSMVPSEDEPAFFFDMFRKLAATDSKAESDAYNITGDVGTTSQAHG